MTQSIDRPLHQTAQEQNRRTTDKARAEGAQTLRAANVRRPNATRVNHERQVSYREQLTVRANTVANARLRDVREHHQRRTGEPSALNTETTYLAYIAQKARLENTDLTDEMTIPELVSELTAEAVLFGPSASEAQKSPRYYKNKQVLATYNDIVPDIVRLVRPEQLTDVTAVIRDQSLRLGHAAGQSSVDIAKKGQIEQLIRGVRAEIAVENAMMADPSLDAYAPKDVDDDLKGIDLVVERPSDGMTAYYDVKSSGSYANRIGELRGLGKNERPSLSGTDRVYYYAGQHSDNTPHYLINADAEIFGDIQTAGNEFTASGQARVQQVIHETLGER